MLACIPNCNPNTTQHRKDLEPISALQYLNAGSCLNTVVLSTIIDWGMAILQLGSEHHLHKHFQNESVGLMQPSGIPALSRTKHMAYSHRCHAKLTRQRDLCLGMVWWWVKPSICKPTRVTVQDALARSQCTRHTNHFRSVLAEWCWQLIAKDLPQLPTSHKIGLNLHPCSSTHRRQGLSAVARPLPHAWPCKTCPRAISRLKPRCVRCWLSPAILSFFVSCPTCCKCPAFRITGDPTQSKKLKLSLEPGHHPEPSPGLGTLRFLCFPNGPTAVAKLTASSMQLHVQPRLCNRNFLPHLDP